MTQTIAFARTDDDLTDLHCEIASTLEEDLHRLGEVLECIFGEGPAHAALRALMVDSCIHGPAREEFRAECDRLGWRAYLAERSGYIDAVELTHKWREGAEYAGQGIAPRERSGGPVSLDDRKRRIEALIAYGQVMLRHGATLFGGDHLGIWKGVAARAAIDFGGTVTLEGVHLLSGVSLGAVRNAVSLGELQPDEAGNIPAEEAKAWLARRRDFCPSRWENPSDDQAPLDAETAVKGNDKGMISVPQDGEGTPFTPEHVVRTAKSGPGLSITVGAKGSEEQHRDFYEALAALTRMDVARWRRRNGAGNWGIVRARGPWVAVSKAEIDRQLAARAAEVA